MGLCFSKKSKNYDNNYDYLIYNTNLLEPEMNYQKQIYIEQNIDETLYYSVNSYII